MKAVLLALAEIGALAAVAAGVALALCDLVGVPSAAGIGIAIAGAAGVYLANVYGIADETGASDVCCEVRVAAAKKLLQEKKSFNITEIALACGFQSAQYFATQFRKKTGISPREFRRQLVE